VICDHCDQIIYVTTEDPLCHTSRGRFHYRCLLAWHEEAGSRRSTAARVRRQQEELPDLDPDCFNEKIGPPGQENSEED
jgi:hypothetical protein